MPFGLTNAPAMFNGLDESGVLALPVPICGCIY
jgi:hypothetical protein